MEIEVVLRKIGKHRHVKGDVRYPVQLQGVRRNFNNRMGEAAVYEKSQRSLELQAVWCSETSVCFNPRCCHTKSSHYAALYIRSLQDGINDVSSGCFTVGTGNAHRGQFFRRVAVQIGGNAGKCLPDILHPNRGCFQIIKYIVNFRSAV